MNKKLLTVSLVLLTAGFSALSSAQEGAVKYRQAIMKAVAGHSGAIAQIAYGGVAHKEHLQSHVDGLVAMGKQVDTAFKEEAMTEDPPTRAKPEIWEKWSDFEGKSADMGKAIAGVADAAGGGDMGAVAGSLDALWDSCKGCHKEFRAKAE